MTYIILTQAQADQIGKLKLNDFIGVDPYAGKLTDGTYALPKGEIISELAQYGLLKGLTDRLDITTMIPRNVEESEWDKTGWEL